MKRDRDREGDLEKDRERKERDGVCSTSKLFGRHLSPSANHLVFVAYRGLWWSKNTAAVLVKWLEWLQQIWKLRVAKETLANACTRN